MHAHTPIISILVVVSMVLTSAQLPPGGLEIPEWIVGNSTKLHNKSDADHDGCVSLNEMLVHAHANATTRQNLTREFHDFDNNKDGCLTVYEIMYAYYLEHIPNGRKRRAVVDKRGALDEKRLAAAEKREASDEKREASDEKREASDEKREAFDEKREASDEKQWVAAEKRRAGAAKLSEAGRERLQ